MVIVPPVVSATIVPWFTIDVLEPPPITAPLPIAPLCPRTVIPAPMVNVVAACSVPGPYELVAEDNRARTGQRLGPHKQHHRPNLSIGRTIERQTILDAHFSRVGTQIQVCLQGHAIQAVVAVGGGH